MEHRQNDYRRSQKEANGSRNYLGIGLALLLASAAFFSGMQMGTSQNGLSMEAGLFALFARTPQPDTTVDMSEFWRVWNLMDEKFAASSTTAPLSAEEKVQGAISGLVEAYGDPYTVFFPPSDAEKFDEEISGNFGGVGMEVGVRDGVITVIAPLPDTPAENAGILAGDVIVKIDDTSTENMTIDEAVKLIRGEKGTEVRLTIYREGETDFLEIPVVRDTITIPTIKTEQRGDVFIIALYSFNALAEMKMQQALREYVQSGADKLVLDLRGNPGGFLQSAVSIASYFIPAGEVIVRENFGDGSEEEVYRSSGKTLRDFAPKKMVVLINGGSASAAEILAGALSEHGIATLMGQQSFGKGSVQELVDLPSGASLKVTIARWFTPNGTSISEGGLTPDIVVERTPQQMLEDIDPQMEAALKYLRGDLSFASSTPFRASSTVSGE